MKKKASMIKRMIWFCIVLNSAFIGCFNAPSPSYLRPGHPDWPVGWCSDKPSDSLEQHMVSLKQYGITCMGIRVEAARGREKDILKVCRRNDMKLYLKMEFTTDIWSSESSDSPEMDHVVLQHMSEVLTPWMQNRKKHFPFDLIPAIQVTCDPSVNKKGRIEQSLNRILIVQKAMDHIAPGILICFQLTDKLFLSGSQIKRRMKGQSDASPFSVIQPQIRIESRHEDIQNLSRTLMIADSLANITEALFIPSIQLSSTLSSPDEIGDLINLLQSVSPDAVIWENINAQSSSGSPLKFKAFHDHLRMQFF